jgi:signal peptidase I
MAGTKSQGEPLRVVRGVLVFAGIVAFAVVISLLKVGDGGSLIEAPLFTGHRTTSVTFPAVSMEPTIVPGQTIVFDDMTRCCQRGDIILFEAPSSVGLNPGAQLVARVVGLPGETVTFRSDQRIYIDDRRVREPYLARNTPTLPENTDVPSGCGKPPDGNPGCVVPVGSVFVLGDNRLQAKDSRSYGPVSQHLVMGNAGLG